MKVENFKKIIITTLLLFSCAGQAENRIDTQRPDAPELAAYGNNAIGVRTIELLNPDQLDIARIDVNKPRPEALPRYDRPLTVEVWYPAKEGAIGGTALNVYLRDGRTAVTIEGKAIRGATPAEGRYPLVLVSHGYPGNRFLMSHLAENLASKGYVVASIDHTDSTYRSLGAFASTLVNRSLDQLFVLDQMARLSNDESSFLNGHVDASNTGLIGYSMGGYGAVITSGGGVSEVSANSKVGSPFGTLAIHQANTASHNALPDSRIKTAVAFAPWGMSSGMWDSESLKGVKIPMFFIAGSVDDVSGYETGVRAIWDGAINTDRSLLTFENANHNAGATMPAPKESFRFDQTLGFNLSEHYTDAVWSNTRMNNIAQHFVTVWMAKHLKLDNSMDQFTNLIERSNDGVWAIEKDGTEQAEHTYWKGFANRTAKGLRFETLEAVK
jgi:predicted dienelactone hydrolase